MRIARRSREHSVLRDITWGILPVIFFLHFIITGTIVLVYTLYIHDSIPQNYAIGAAITFGCILVLLALGHLILYYRRPLRPPSDLEILSASGSDKSTMGKKVKDWYHNLRLFLQRYGEHQRRHVKEFKYKEKQKRRSSRGTLGGFVPINELSTFQLLEKKLLELVDELKRRRKRRRAVVATIRKPAGNQRGSSRNKQAAAIDLQHNSAALDALGRGVNFEELEGRRNTVSLSQDSHKENVRARTGQELEGDSIPDNVCEKTLKRSYQHPTVEEHIISPPNTKRKSSVLPEDILIEEHPPPSNYQSGQRAYSFPQTSDASRSVHSIHGGGTMVQRFPKPGNAIRTLPPVSTHQQQGFNRQAATGLSRKANTTTEALISLPMKSADMSQPPRLLKQTTERLNNDLTNPSDDFRSIFKADYGKTLDEMTAGLSKSQPLSEGSARSKSKSVGKGSINNINPPAKKTSRVSPTRQQRQLHIPFSITQTSIPIELPGFQLPKLSPLDIDFDRSRSSDMMSARNGRKPFPTGNSSHKDMIKEEQEPKENKWL